MEKEIKKFKNLEEYFSSQLFSREDVKDLIIRSSLNLLLDCSRNFDESPTATEETAQPLYYLAQILDMVE